MVDVSGDGDENEGFTLGLDRQAAHRRGITINGLPILDEGPDDPLAEDYVRDIIGGPGAFVVPALGRDGFVAAVRRKLILEIAGMMPDPEPTGIEPTSAAAGQGEGG